MKLTMETTLHGIVSALQDQILPAVEAPFAKEVTRLAAMLTAVMANGVDDAAAARIWENDALRTLFKNAGALATDILVTNSLAERLAEASRSVDPGYKISELDAENGRLRNLLVKLHAMVEVREDAESRALDRQIWTLLGAIHERRAPRSQ